MASLAADTPVVAPVKYSLIDQFQNWSLRTLMTVVWSSTLLFGLYILAFYVSSYTKDPQIWNESLSGLYVIGGSLANSSIGLHFLAGGIILVMGCIQLLRPVRQNLPILHRICGRLYLLACLITAFGGLVFIIARGTIGGLVMDLGFGLYGVLMSVCVFQTFRYARGGKFNLHRSWALRLFALAVGSWLYRMEYGLWFMMTDAIGHRDNFTGWFDQLMAFFFYIPNLLIVELFLRGQRRQKQSIWIRSSLVGVYTCSSVLVAIGTWAFWNYFWSKPILSFLNFA